MFTRAKDWASSKAASVWLRGVIGKYAELKSFEIDSTDKKLKIVILPKGEAEDIEFTVAKYEIREEADSHIIIVGRIDCSKEWIRLLAIDHLVGKKFEIPGAAAKML